MAKPKRPPHRLSSKRQSTAGRNCRFREALKDVDDLSIRSELGKPASYAFSLEFPAMLTAIVRSEEAGGFSAEVPALPGCFTEGETWRNSETTSGRRPMGG